MTDEEIIKHQRREQRQRAIDQAIETLKREGMSSSSKLVVEVAKEYISFVNEG